MVREWFDFDSGLTRSSLGTRFVCTEQTKHTSYVHVQDAPEMLSTMTCR